MFENRKDTLKFVGELAIVFLPAFTEELDRNHHRASPVHAALAALLIALPLALCAHLSKNKWNRMDWKALCLFLAVTGLTVLIKWRKISPDFSSAAFLDLLKTASWINASILVVYRLWEQAEGSGEEFPSVGSEVSPSGST
jgi:hypothetical protein